MVDFPRPTRRRAQMQVVAASAALLLAGTTVLAPLASAEDKLHKKKRQVHSQVRTAQSDLEDSSRALAAATRRLTASREALAAAQTKLAAAQTAVNAAAAVDAQMAQKLVEAQAALDKARADLETARNKVTEQRREIGELAATNYMHGDPALMGLTVILNSQDPVEATAQMNTVDSLMGRQTNTLEELRSARHELVLREVDVEQAKRAVEDQRQQAAANLARTKTLQAAAAQVQSDVAAKVAENRSAEAAALVARRADLATLRALQQQENKIKRMIIERARRQHGGFRGNAGGFLFRPVPGGVTSPYGWREHPIYHYWGLHNGTDFSAPCGTPMRASGSGTVIARSYSDVYGNRLYLDLGQVNGHNLTVVYNHATSYRYGVGARVGRGDVVGYAGTTGWSTGCHLHFMVLRDGNPVDPMGYM